MTTERSIPHLRDIFGLSINQKNQEPTYNHPTPNNVDIEKPSKKSKKSKSSGNGQQNGGELKTLERHLSMKKTIRKKIMRDLQQAFVDDPNEFKVDNNEDRLKSELNLEAMRYGDNHKHRSRKSDNFLDMLRGDQNANGINYNNNLHNSHLTHQQQQQPPQPYKRPEQNLTTGEENYPDIHQQLPINNNEKQSFWSRFGIRNKNKR